MYVKEVVVLNQVGLHARPATFFIQCANSFTMVSIWIEKDGKRVNAKSLLGVLSLGVIGGSKINIIADSKEADAEQEAVDTLVKLIESGFTDVEQLLHSKDVDPLKSIGDLNANLTSSTGVNQSI